MARLNFTASTHKVQLLRPQRNNITVGRSDTHIQCKPFISTSCKQTSESTIFSPYMSSAKKKTFYRNKVDENGIGVTICKNLSHVALVDLGLRPLKVDFLVFRLFNEYLNFQSG